MAGERVAPLCQVETVAPPYFSIVLVPGCRDGESDEGAAYVVGLGPGSSSWIYACAQKALETATDVYATILS